MKSEPLGTDSSGMLRAPGIHDAVVQAIHYVADSRLDLVLKDPSGVTRTFSFLDVPRVGFKDVVNGQIVSDLFCWKLNDEAARQPAAMDAWRVLLGGNCRDSDLSDLVGVLARLYADMVLVSCESSYGGSMAAICREIRVDSP